MASRAAARFWRARMDAARTPHAQAHVEWERLRAEVAKLPDGPYRDGAWRLVRKYLSRCHRQVVEEIARDAE